MKKLLILAVIVAIGVLAARQLRDTTIEDSVQEST
jgi:hypothetical protein